jgi:hypothetical protein
MKHTECSSCLTSRTVPSLKVHFATSASGDELASSLLVRLVQKLAKSPSLMRCHTAARGASMTVLSRTPAAVGMPDMMNFGVVNSREKFFQLELPLGESKLMCCQHQALNTLREAAAFMNRHQMMLQGLSCCAAARWGVLHDDRDINLLTRDCGKSCPNLDFTKISSSSSALLKISIE